MKKIFALSVLFLLLFAVFTFAEIEQEQEQNEGEDSDDSEEIDETEDDETEDDTDSEEIDEDVEDTEDDEEIDDEEAQEIEDVESELEIETEKDENGKNKVKVKFKDGTESEVKVMPSTASDRAIEALSLNNCVAEEGCTIELKDVGNGKLAYEIETEKESKIFGLFKTKMHVQAQIDAETGELIRAKKAWWAFLASEDDEEGFFV